MFAVRGGFGVYGVEAPLLFCLLELWIRLDDQCFDRLPFDYRFSTHVSCVVSINTIRQFTVRRHSLAYT